MKRSERLLLDEPVSYRPFKTELEDWAEHGCHNNEEWHVYLKSLFERDLYSDVIGDCYVGVIQKEKKKQPDD